MTSSEAVHIVLATHRHLPPATVGLRERAGEDHVAWTPKAGVRREPLAYTGLSGSGIDQKRRMGPVQQTED